MPVLESRRKPQYRNDARMRLERAHLLRRSTSFQGPSQKLSLLHRHFLLLAHPGLGTADQRHTEIKAEGTCSARDRGTVNALLLADHTPFKSYPQACHQPDL